MPLTLSNVTPIVADGWSRFRRSKVYLEASAKFESEVRERRSKEFETASWLRRLFLNLAVEREVRTRLARAVPEYALYSTHSLHSVRNQSSEPALSSVTPPAGQESRPR